MVTLDEAGCNRVGTRVRTWRGPARAFVQHDFTLDFRAVSRPEWKVVPDSAAHLLIHLGGREAPGGPRLVLVGARSHGIEIDVRDRGWTVGVRLAVGAIPALTGLPAEVFTDTAVAARTVPGWGQAVDPVEEAAAVGDVEGTRAALAELVAGRIRRAASVSWIASALERTAASADSSFRVADIAERLGVAPRTLRLRSAEEIGLSPKRLLRIERLFRAISLARSRGYRDWSVVASRTGFADQPHMVREFRSLLGETPTRFAGRGRSDAESFKPVGGRPGTVREESRGRG